MANSLDQRYDKARENCVWFHLENWGVLRVAGPDARDFLQRMGTADLRDLAAGAGSQSLFLKGDGRLTAEAAVLCVEAEKFLLVSPPECRAALAEQLERFHFSEQLVMTDVSDEMLVGMLAGPRRREVMELLIANNPAALNGSVSAKVDYAPASPRLLLLIQQARFAKMRTPLYDAVQSAGGVIGGADLYEALRIEEGVPAFGAELSDKVIPLEAGQKPAISFTKGCFPGQEIVARINNLGHPANVLVGLALPESADDLAGRTLQVDGKDIGRITSTSWSPGLRGMMGLGFVKWAQREPGTVFGISGDEDFRATVLALPLPGVDVK